MKHFFNIVLVALMLVGATKSMALSCVSTSGALTTQTNITERIAIPPLAPVGTVVWRSETFEVEIKCWHENPYTSIDDYVYYVFMGSYHADQGPGNVFDIGDRLEPGISSGGVDSYCSKNSAQGGCGLNTYMGLPKCNSVAACEASALTRKFTFSTFLAVKKQGKPNQEGAVTNPIALYPLVQFRGFLTGNSTTAAGNYTIYVGNLNKLQYVGCSSSVQIEPRTIDFQRVPTSLAHAGDTIADKPFTITATKSCSTPYGLTGSFQPISGRLSADNNTLIPATNNSVGIQILTNDTKKPLPFKQEFTIAPTTNTDLSYNKNLLARLLWLKDTAKVGEFNAAARLDVYYK